MNLKTKYMGLQLEHPFIAGASYLTKSPDAAKRLEDAGAAALVLPSLFEEQITKEKLATLNELEQGTNSFGEALSYLPEPKTLSMGNEAYLDNLRKIKKVTSIPVIASLNGYTYGGWADYAKSLEEAGANAIELNVYFAPTNPEVTSQNIEKTLLSIAKLVTTAVKIPVAVKLSSQFSSVSNICVRLADEAGVKGLVLFNRFFQPDFDIEKLEVEPALNLSTSAELPLRLAFAGILFGKTKASIAITGGVHTPEDAIKAIMSGADTVQMASALINKGVGYIGEIKQKFAEWADKHEYKSLDELRGSMSLSRCPNPEAYQRLNYMRLLKGWQDK